ncbi:hypothetical protein [Chryseobacterium sp. 8AT]|uniref:hypothetical protein n=1 Tax=Chryseobacterium sp. 8AT TaxID=2653134 RepID=UPI0012F2B20A|nr:hypothetical protein [Chryseobacterium sp. 8AT]VXB02037.1 conserved hypothetical protein [Chryseobacterium sp. 8AT]
MRKLRKITRTGLKGIQGGIESCIQNCLEPGYRKCCIKGKPYVCISDNQLCA